MKRKEKKAIDTRVCIETMLCFPFITHFNLCGCIYYQYISNKFLNKNISNNNKKKDSLLTISSLFLTFVLIFFLSLRSDLFTCLLGEFPPFPSVVHS